MTDVAETPPTTFDELTRRLDELLSAEENCVGTIILEACNMPRIDARFGRAHRNRMLEKLSAKIDESVRPQDVAVQIGDHSFAIALPGLKNQGHAMLAAKKLLRLAEPETPEPSRDQGVLDVRLGVALYPDHAANSAELLQRAQLALEVAKDTRQDAVVYNADNVGKVATAWELRDDLADAIRESELDVHYQPKIDVQTGEIWGAEALARWFSETRGPVRPDKFIQVAEESGLIRPLTRYVLNTAMRNMMMWQRDGHQIGIAVNIPASMLLDRGLVTMMESLLSIWDIEPGRLTLELTESAIMADVDTCFDTMSALKDLGARMSIDDFGTGYSSFSYFKNIPADELKIDRTFIAGMVDDPGDQHIVETIISLAHRFDMKVVAEGIENAETLEMLKKLGCDVGQGYHIARPMTQEDYDAWLDARRYVQPEI